jgi:hypothetical protein
MSHQILEGGECVAGHGLTGCLDQPLVPVLGSSDCLGLRVARWLWQTRKNRFDKSIQQGMERLLTPDNPQVVTGYVLKSSRDPIFALGQFGPPVEFVLDCRPDECARTCVPPSFHGFIDPNPIFPAQSDGDSGTARRSHVLSHKITPSITKRLSKTQISPGKFPVKHLSNTDAISFDDARE